MFGYCTCTVCSYLNMPVEYGWLVRLLDIQAEVGVVFSKIHQLEKLRLTVIYEKGGILSQLYRLLTAG